MTRTGGFRAVGPSVALPSPSFVASHPLLPVIYAACETDPGEVAVLAVAENPKTPLQVVQRRPSGGRMPCHVCVINGGRTLAVTHFEGGLLTLFPIDEQGTLTSPPVHFQAATKSATPPGPTPYLHMTIELNNRLYVTDLGADRLHRVEMADGSLGMSLRWVEPRLLSPGSGPRHAVNVANEWFIVNELSNSVSAFTEGAHCKDWQELWTVKTSRSAVACAPSHITRRGPFLYVGNRGPDTISVLPLVGGELGIVGEVKTGGRWPRHFAIADDRLLVANQHSGRLTTLRFFADQPVPVLEPETFEYVGVACVVRLSEEWSPPLDRV